MTAYRHLVALGSSFAAGPGIEPIVERAARRSGRNYPHLLAERLGAELTDRTVCGATTATILSEPQVTGRGVRFAPQLDGLPADADLITITAGGNDLGYAAGLLRAGYAGWLQRLPPLRPIGRAYGRNAVPPAGPADVERATAGLADIVTAARQRAPAARVVLVDYLTVFGADPVPRRIATLSAEHVLAFRRIADQLAGSFAAAAHRTGADLVAASTLSLTHALGSPQPWVTGFAPAMRAVPFHPNAAGMQAVADAIYQHLSA
jgi:lysophospholipase L1-like esterase